MTPRSVVLVGGSTAGSTLMRELRRRGFEGDLTLIDPADGTHRPPLSKAVLTSSTDSADSADSAERSVVIDHAGLGMTHHRSAAVGLDPDARHVVTADGEHHRYDALVVATGAHARRLAEPGQRGEVVLRTLTDARDLRRRMADSTTAVVVGGGFLGFEVATAIAHRGTAVTIVDPQPPLPLLGPYLAARIVERAEAMGITVLTSSATLIGNPVSGVELGDGRRLEADLVVSCVGDLPATSWLAGTPLGTPRGVQIDELARTSAPGVYAIGDVAFVRSGGVARRTPQWANAVTQARVAAAAVLGQPVADPIVDPYYWTDIAGLPVKIVGPLPTRGTPAVLEDAGDAGAILAWEGPTVAAIGLRRPASKLRAIARSLATIRT
ncbi:NAD(P)/FAD-dependent oxidoreductase [Nocardioides plantarum]|uniref:NAD(P)/FAD-dependent oxidoreductase n=1 Tax=Nocardioides plantarum TaxID=29299 RepID=A0ABV5K9Q3_9ACTN|nr:FAD-dependent oxidoreductase [Nocardioides plantarum]